MNMKELVNAVREIVRERTPEGMKPYFNIRVEYGCNSGGESVSYSCYADPFHRHYHEFPTPEALLASLAGTRIPVELPNGELPCLLASKERTSVEKSGTG